MAVVGLGLMIWFAQERRRSEIVKARADQREDSSYTKRDSGKGEFRRTDSSLWLRRLALTTLLLFPLIIPTDWTKGDVIPPKEPTQVHELHGLNMKSAQEKKMSPTAQRGGIGPRTDRAAISDLTAQSEAR
jgi:hypothetical protein